MKEIKRTYTPPETREVKATLFADELQKMLFGFTTIEYKTLFGGRKFQVVYGDQRNDK